MGRQKGKTKNIPNICCHQRIGKILHDSAVGWLILLALGSAVDVLFVFFWQKENMNARYSSTGGLATMQ